MGKRLRLRGGYATRDFRRTIFFLTVTVLIAAGSVFLFAELAERGGSFIRPGELLSAAQEVLRAPQRPFVFRGGAAEAGGGPSSLPVPLQSPSDAFASEALAPGRAALFPGPPPEDADAPEVSAKAAVLLDAASGRVLYAREPHARLPMASLTKIMTAIVALEATSDPEEVVTVSPNAEGVEGSSIYLRAGDKIPLRDLLYGLMLRSGNDAAMAVAEHVGGSVEGFSFLMNEKAAWLGLTDTHFVNPHGLDAEGHYASAYDLAVLSRYAMENPTFREIVGTRVYRPRVTPSGHGNSEAVWTNKNKLLVTYEGAEGIKTAYTDRAGRGLAASAVRDGRRLIAVVLNAPDDWNDVAKLFDYGFSRFPQTPIVRKGEVYTGVRGSYVALADLAYPLRPEEVPRIGLFVQEAEFGPFRPNAFLKVYLGQEAIGSVPLAPLMGDAGRVVSPEHRP
ncbi:MAG: D-alanyl-D-alanine carboxypeptidase [Brockia lithotrophica]|uniref:D-alanyl-D-alanine carboxypeptidase n=1 Tax=Brockia lithotrophica TaxID=933949 RepID=A0A2T5G616_9BACL|nr:MAG: D-alanyl-D-alanine carboxypeptidase [Brockia lithotrophica]